MVWCSWITNNVVYILNFRTLKGLIQISISIMLIVVSEILMVKNARQHFEDRNRWGIFWRLSSKKDWLFWGSTSPSTFSKRDFWRRLSMFDVARSHFWCVCHPYSRGPFILTPSLPPPLTWYWSMNHGIRMCPLFATFFGAWHLKLGFKLRLWMAIF